MEKTLREFSALTQNDEIMIYYNNKRYPIRVLEVKPIDASKGEKKINMENNSFRVPFVPFSQFHPTLHACAHSSSTL